MEIFLQNQASWVLDVHLTARCSYWLVVVDACFVLAVLATAGFSGKGTALHFIQNPLLVDARARQT
jgi:hypothetical protein